MLNGEERIRAKDGKEEIEYRGWEGGREGGRERERERERER